MRYHLDTIPVWDALKSDAACPLCALRRQTEHLLAERFLGGSVMEPDTRVKVNEKGFCGRHHRMLYALQNRLGHALMMQSHMDEVRKRVAAFFDGEKAPAKGGLLRLIGGKAEKAAPEREKNSCILCDTLEETMQRYRYSFVHLYKTDDAFRRQFAASKGVCLRELVPLQRMASEELSGDSYADFMETLKSVTLKAFDKNKQDLDWFTLKFDYRNADKSWGDSRDALERSVNFLSGWTLGDDPGKPRNGGKT